MIRAHMLNPEEVNYVIAHGNCPDGMGAAWSAWTLHNTKIDYHFETSHGQKDKSLLPDVSGRNVLMLDFAYNNPETMSYIANSANKFLVLDHHIGAKNQYEGNKDWDHVFDISKSGARMAWEFFHPGEPIPPLIQYIEDRDLYTWKYDESRAFLAALDSYPMNFDTYDFIHTLQGDELELFLQEGRAINRFQQGMVSRTVEKAVPAYLHVPKMGCRLCNVVNCASKEIISDVGHKLSSVNMFGMVWSYSHEKEAYLVSLRSIGDLDVCKIAQEFGGGGHKNASGFAYHGDIRSLIDYI